MPGFTLALARGITLALCACSGAREVEFHLLDVVTGELYGLDGRSCVLAREACSGARLLAHDGEALWLAGDGARGGWLERRAEGSAGRLAFRAPRALAPGADGDLYLFDGDAQGRSRLWQIEPWLSTRFLGEFEPGTQLAWDGEALLVGTGSGTLLRLRRDGAQLAALELAAPIVALAATPAGAGGLALLAGPTPRLACFERALTLRWSVALAESASALAVDGERVWLVEGEELVRVGPEGTRELALELPLRGGPWQACVADDGRVWLRGQGAWLEVDSAGPRAWIARAQGGFAELSAAVRVRAGAGPRRAGSSRRARPRAPARAPS